MIWQSKIKDNEKILLVAEASFKFSQVLQSHLDELDFSEDDRKLTAGWATKRNSDHRIVLADIAFDSSKAYWEIIIDELVSIQLPIMTCTFGVA